MRVNAPSYAEAVRYCATARTLRLIARSFSSRCVYLSAKRSSDIQLRPGFSGIIAQRLRQFCGRGTTVVAHSHACQSEPCWRRFSSRPHHNTLAFAPRIGHLVENRLRKCPRRNRARRAANSRRPAHPSVSHPNHASRWQCISRSLLGKSSGQGSKERNRNG